MIAKSRPNTFADETKLSKSNAIDEKFMCQGKNVDIWNGLPIYN